MLDGGLPINWSNALVSSKVFSEEGKVFIKANEIGT
jgi:hypothetical protein